MTSDNRHQYTDLDSPQRLAELRATALLDTLPEEAFDRLTALVTSILNVPVALVSLVTNDRQFFKSASGLGEPWVTLRETGLSHSFCQHTVRQATPFIVDNAPLNDIVRDNLAIPDLNVMAYAGIPLITSDGYVLGAFCAIDNKPRKWTDREVQILTELTATVMTEIELRMAIRRVEDSEKEMERALHDRDLLLSIISHDLKNPLASILGFSQLLQRRIAKQTSIEETVSASFDNMLKQIESASRNMAHILNGLVDTAKQQHGVPLDLELQTTNMVALARRVATQQQIIAKHNIKLSIEQDEIIGVWDEARLERVLDNLISNAIKYSPNHDEIEVKVGSEADAAGKEWVKVSVSDHGIGIPARDLPTIFQWYKRASNVTNQIVGTGVGLASALQIVKEHGGTITVDSEEGKGSTFTMELPLVSTLPAATASEDILSRV